MKKIILFCGGVETLEYFSKQIGEALQNAGYEVFIFNLQNMLGSFHDLLMFCKKGEGVLITFNFIGLSGEPIFEGDKGVFFDEYEIRCLNIVVDHPFYYHRQLRNLPKDYVQFCIDRTHMAYMQQYFPEVRLGEFLPLAGTELVGNSIGMSEGKQGQRFELDRGIGCHRKAAEREMDIVFTGNYTLPRTFDKEINRLGKEYADFYQGIIDDLIYHPNQPMDVVFAKHIKRDIPEAGLEDLKNCMENMIFIDLYVRFYMRGKAVQTLVDSGFHVHVYGNGLERISYRRPECITFHGGVKSVACLRKLGRAKVSLNVMPWFKDGAHDRVFSAALNGAVNLTDGSTYLKEVFSGKDDCVFYDLEHMERLPELAENLLKDYDLLDSMAERAYEAAKIHRWEERTRTLQNYI